MNHTIQDLRRAFSLLDDRAPTAYLKAGIDTTSVSDIYSENDNKRATTRRWPQASFAAVAIVVATTGCVYFVGDRYHRELSTGSPARSANSLTASSTQNTSKGGGCTSSHCPPVVPPVNYTFRIDGHPVSAGERPQVIEGHLTTMSLILTTTDAPRTLRDVYFTLTTATNGYRHQKKLPGATKLRPGHQLTSTFTPTMKLFGTNLLLIAVTYTDDAAPGGATSERVVGELLIKP